MKILAIVVSAVLLSTAGRTQAAISAFTNYGYTGGTTASWDLFAGGNYQPSYAFASGIPGNPSTNNVTIGLTASATPGQTYHPGNPAPANPFGPTNANETFYTLWSRTQFSMVLTVASGTLTDLAFQGLTTAGGFGGDGVLLNGLAASPENVVPITTDSAVVGIGYSWSNLNFTAGQTITLTWFNSEAHTGYEAFQLQTNAAVVPEPSRLMLGGLALGALFMRRRRSLVR
ncbi:PEP-CTERM sorting domain-containing protein [Phragmitibacter flavus]|uniref:PEP-CTERM sorting domain-containing protein n=1 Tax=Phragmitibacter flavus TaxID=2576071 RepID=A0A5R8KJW2_9BACT|nr:PEP-CTERM sorting domain-containing protein [Phragmitibacter flavus]TLD72604.1 PEP-CTERM sorting domain-containing protein [Phragmitibacter flavus]